MPIYTWRNLETNERVEVLSSIADRNVPPPGEGTWERVPEMPGFTRYTYLDGQRKDLADFKAISKLQTKAADLAADDPVRAEIGKEIADRKKI